MFAQILIDFLFRLLPPTFRHIFHPFLEGINFLEQTLPFLGAVMFQLRFPVLDQFADLN